MANVLINEDTMSDIADAIREKKGVSTTYKPAQMPDAISSITGGGITPTGTINITTNGTHDVTNYASASVAVPQGTTPTGTKEISITQNGTTTEDVTNYASAQITVNVQGGGGSSSVFETLFKGKLTGNVTFDITGHSDIQIPSGTANYDWYSYLFQGHEIVNFTGRGFVNLPPYGFKGMTTLETVKFEDATFPQTTVFGSCTALRMAVFPKLEVGYRNYGWLSASMFNGCSNLETVDLGKLTHIGASMFRYCSKLSIVILRSQSMVQLKEASCFQNSSFVLANLSGGTIYVPSALISAYEADSLWSAVLAGNENNKILSIEGSIYETQYADGSSITV